MIQHKILKNDFPYIEISNQYAHAKIALQGAHLFAYKATDKPALLWLSPKATMQEGKAIRGGIPICFPWFGKHKVDSTLPQHGFARTSLWKVVNEEERTDGATHIRLQLTQTANTRKLWAYDFEVNLDVIVGETLSLTMHIINTDTKSFEVSTALHTYLNISDIENVEVVGLDGSEYYDALTKSTKRQEGNLSIHTEIDRVYHHKQKSITLLDTSRKIGIISEGSGSLVIWNPWKEKSIAMADMSDDGYRTMLCLETANTHEDSRVIEVGQMHSIDVVYEQGEKCITPHTLENASTAPSI